MATRHDRHYSIPAMIVTEQFGEDCRIAASALNYILTGKGRIAEWPAPVLKRAAERFKTRAKRVRETLRRQGKVDLTVADKGADL